MSQGNNSIAHALGGSCEESTYHGQCSGSIVAVTKALQKLAEKLKVEFCDLKVCCARTDASKMGSGLSNLH